MMQWGISFVKFLDETASVNELENFADKIDDVLLKKETDLNNYNVNATPITFIKGNVDNQ